MLVVVSISFIAILFTFLDSRGILKNGMWFGFVLITVLGCIHYNYGNDYIGYHELFDEITSRPLQYDDLLDSSNSHDPGWVVLNHLFKHLGGFFMMVFVLNIFQNVIYFRFIKENVEKKKWAFAIMIYLLSGSLYIINFSMMRQGLAIALFVWSWKYIKERRMIPTLIILFVASTIHHSAQILLPFVLFAIIPINNKIVAVTFISLFFALYLSSSFLSNVFSSFNDMEQMRSNQYLEYYSRDSNSDDRYAIGLGFLVNLIPFVVAMWALFRKEAVMDGPHKLLISLSMISFLIAPFGQKLAIIGRYSMYFDALKIAAVPYIYSLLPKKLCQVLTAVFILMLLYGYYSFFHSPVWIKDYSTFHTIFSVIYILRLME